MLRVLLVRRVLGKDWRHRLPFLFVLHSLLLHKGLLHLRMTLRWVRVLKVLR